MSPVAGGVNSDEQSLVVSTYPSRDKVHNIRRNPQVTIYVDGDWLRSTWVQVDGSPPWSIYQGHEQLVDYSSISGHTPTGTSTGQRWKAAASP